MKSNAALRFLLKLLACFALIACGSAQATSCYVRSNGFSSAYVPATATRNMTPASFTMTCTRSASGDALSQAYTVKVDNGLWATASGNQAASGANRISYDVYTDSGCVTLWKGNTTLGGTINFSSSTDYTAREQTVPFFGCIPALQTTVPAGTYSDTVTMSAGPTFNNLFQSDRFPVSIATPSSCSISKSPNPVSLTYTSFQGALPAISSFEATCTSLLPYTMALDATSGVLVGLNYTLSLSASSAVGNGLAQPYTINVSIAAGQAGTCAIGTCSATKTHTLTISY